MNWGYVFGKKVGIFNIFHFEEKNGWLNWKLVLLVTLKLERIRDMIHQGSFQSADLKWLRLLSNYLRVNIQQIFQETIRVTKSADTTSNIYLYFLFSMYLIGYLLTIRNCLENIETYQALVDVECQWQNDILFSRSSFWHFFQVHVWLYLNTYADKGHWGIFWIFLQHP